MRLTEITFVVLAASACGRGGFNTQSRVPTGPAPGTEGGPCVTGGCDAPLICDAATTTCVAAPDECVPRGCSCVDPDACTTECVAPRSCGGGGANGACGAAFYIAAQGGSDSASGLTSGEAWATFTHSWTVLQPGDALVLTDGTYSEPLSPTISGSPTAPIAICSASDGGAILDGGGSQVPCNFDLGIADSYIEHLDVSGIVCRNSNLNVIKIDLARFLTFRRVSAYQADLDESVIHAWRSSDLLLEDVAASGTGSILYHIISSDRVTLRRAWGRFVDSTDINRMGISVSFGADDVSVENCVVTVAPGSPVVIAWAVYGGPNRTEALGSVMVNPTQWTYHVSAATSLMTGTRVTNSVGIGWGLMQRSDDDLRIDRLTLVDVGTGVRVLSTSTEPKDDGYVMNGDLRNSVIVSNDVGIQIDNGDPYMGALTHDYNTIYGATSPHVGTTRQPNELDIEPTYDTSTFGTGAYLIGPENLAGAGEGGGPMGAEVLYRYVDGQLTDRPLWPWPMEERIERETGVSVTWESNGGLWKTLQSVYP